MPKTVQTTKTNDSTFTTADNAVKQSIVPPKVDNQKLATGKKKADKNKSEHTPSERTATLKKKARTESKDLELTINLGEAYLREGKVNEAIKAYEKAIELEPSSDFRSLYYEWLGSFQEIMDNNAAALKAYALWDEVDPISVEPLDRAGNIMLKESLLTDLLLLNNKYKKRVENNPDPDVLESQAIYIYVMEQIGVSDEDLSPFSLACQVLENKHDSISMRYLLGMIYIKMERLDNARTEFMRVLDLDTDHTWEENRFSVNWSCFTAMLMLSKIARIQHNPQQAIDILNSMPPVISESNKDALFEEMASILVEHGEYEMPLTLLPKEIPEIFNSQSMRRLRARCLLGTGRINDALPYYSSEDPLEICQKALHESDLENSPKTPEEQNTKDKDKDKESKENKACTNDTDKADSLEKTAVEQVLAEAKKAFENGKTDKAVDIVEKLLTKYPNNSTVWMELGTLYHLTDNNAKRRLATMHIQSMLPKNVDELNSEWIAPTTPDSNAPAAAVSARAVPGQGNVMISGISGTEIIINIAWTYIKAEAEKFGFKDINKKDIHVHIRELDFDTCSSIKRCPRHALSAPSSDITSCNEDIGLAVVMAITSAITNIFPKEHILAAGSFSLFGTLHNSASLLDGVNRVTESGIKIARILLPRAISPDLNELAPSTIVSSDLLLFQNVAESIALYQANEGETL